MYDDITHYSFSVLRAIFVIYAILATLIKIIAFVVRRKKTISIEEEKNLKIEGQQLKTWDSVAINISIIIILCLCAICFFLVQYGYNSNYICQYNLTEYWNILFCYLLLISFISPDIDLLFKTNFTKSIVFTRWLKFFELIFLTLYIPIILFLIIICP